MHVFYGDIVLPDRILAASYVVCEKGRIASVGRRVPRGAQVIKGAYIAPGYVDLHVHGGDGADYMDGTPQAVRTANRAHLKRGTTSIFPTTTTGSTAKHRMIHACLEVRNSWTVRDGARIAGVHYYGPYFAPEKVGCHSREGCRDPLAEEYERFLALGIIRIATCAAELPGQKISTVQRVDEAAWSLAGTPMRRGRRWRAAIGPASAMSITSGVP